MLFIFHAKDQNIKCISVPNSVLKSLIIPCISLELEIPTKIQHVRDSTVSQECDNLLLYKWQLSVSNEVLMFVTGRKK